MKNMLTGINGVNRSARLLRSTAVALTGLALVLALWSATVPMASAQGNNPARMIEANLPQGQTIAQASKADLLSAVCAAIKKNPRNAPQIARVAATARPEMAGDILRTAFRCATTGANDCALLGRILRSVIAAVPDQASSLTDLAISLAGNCAGSFQPGNGGGEDNGGNFGQGPGNQNPPPGSIGGVGGGQGNVVAICHNGKTIFVSPKTAEKFLALNPGDTLGPCVITPVQNQ